MLAESCYITPPPHIAYFYPLTHRRTHHRIKQLFVAFFVVFSGSAPGTMTLLMTRDKAKGLADPVQQPGIAK